MSLALWLLFIWFLPSIVYCPVWEAEDGYVGDECGATAVGADRRVVYGVGVGGAGVGGVRS